MRVQIRTATRLTYSFRRPLVQRLAASNSSGVLTEMTGSAKAAKLIDELNRTYERGSVAKHSTNIPQDLVQH